ncbi:MAG: sensor domain-containing diguanylate cyclase [Rhodocyclaceae bacterium]|nr:MAG: sensor domain-containing diguanylate cyclase [Rhodocyclaceae bacterium]
MRSMPRIELRIRPLLGLRPARHWLALMLGMAALPVHAALPPGMESPVVTLTAGLATMAGMAGAYLFLRRQRPTRPEKTISPAEQGDVNAWSAVGTEVGNAPSAPGGTRYFLEAASTDRGIEGWLNAEGSLFWINGAIEKATGYSVNEVLAGGFIDRLVYDRDRRYCRDQLAQALEGEASTEFELRLVTKDGRTVWMLGRWQPIRNDEGLLLGLRATLTDIQARKEAEYKLLESVAALRRAQALSEHYLRRSNEERSRLSALLDVVRVGILFMDSDRRVVYCNRALYDIWELALGESFVGVRDVVLQQHVMVRIADQAGYQRHLADVLSNRKPSEPFEIRFLDGRIVTDFSRVVPGPDGTRPIGRIWVFEDVTEQRKVAGQLMRLAERDPLTNIYNRRRFHEELERMLADGCRHAEDIGLLSIDLDGFKPVNDNFGHQAGDRVLIGLAAAVVAVVRRNEMFFRMGGDEFAILVPSGTKTELTELARRVCACIAALRFDCGAESVGVTASIGIAISSDCGNHGESLIGAADRAMYVAKSRGGNGWAFAESDEERLDRSGAAG